MKPGPKRLQGKRPTAPFGSRLSRIRFRCLLQVSLQNWLVSLPQHESHQGYRNSAAFILIPKNHQGFQSFAFFPRNHPDSENSAFLLRNLSDSKSSVLTFFIPQATTIWLVLSRGPLHLLPPRIPPHPEVPKSFRLVVVQC